MQSILTVIPSQEFGQREAELQKTDKNARKSTFVVEKGNCNVNVSHMETLDFCQALCLCVCVSKTLRKWTQTDTKVTFHPPPATHPPPTRKLFLVSNERYGKNKTFLLRWYGIDFAPIKRYRHFCLLWLYIRRQRLSLFDLSTLCP